MKVAIIGECMLEFSKKSDASYTMSYGGDTLNTAVYLARCGGQSDYFTALGNDPFSQEMITNWQSEGVGISKVKLVENQLPGLYLIENDDSGERYFHYWRQNSPARKLISDFPNIFEELPKYQYIFISGITLSLYSNDDLEALFSFLFKYRLNGGEVIFDNNYRSRGWENVKQARKAFNDIMALTDIALISFDDEKALHGEHPIETCIDRWRKYSVKELVLKNGHEGCYLVENGEASLIPLEHVVQPVDTTAAGDSFNGAYIAGKLSGKRAKDCVKDGQVCAANVIMHQGAIIDKSIALMEVAG